jgi:preprotein translocase subunit SecA
MIREDMGDLIYLTVEEKYEAIVEDIKDCYERKQPVLVGTTSIENSELVSDLLTKYKVPHEVLNAKQHEREAHIIAQAGSPGAITIATNMAGRGTDIVLGGNLDSELTALPEGTSADEIDARKSAWKLRHQAVLDAGGLHIIGTERHESRRIDNQLRGRSGRQGDPGSTRFYLSLQDSLMRIFASERVSAIMQKLGMEKGEAIEHPWVSRAIENAQRKVEGHNFDIRKNLLEYDDVANDQRKVIYEQRNELMAQSDISEMIAAIRVDVTNDVIDEYIPRQSLEEQWDISGLVGRIEEEFGAQFDIQRWLDEDDNLDQDGLRQRILDELVALYEEKGQRAGIEVLRHFEKAVMLQVLDNLWKEHLAAMDYLRKGIHLRGYAQKNPKQEYKRESFELFTQLLVRIKNEVIGVVSKVQIHAEEDVEAVEEQRRTQVQMNYQHDEVSALASEQESVDEESEPQPFVRDERKVGRNEPCPCGSGKKYKQCHGRLS